MGRWQAAVRPSGRSAAARGRADDRTRHRVWWPAGRDTNRDHVGHAGTPRRASYRDRVDSDSCADGRTATHSGPQRLESQAGVEAGT